MMNNDVYRRRLDEHQGKLAEEREWWDKKKTSIKEGFMKELDADFSSSGPAAAVAASAVPVQPAAPSVQTSDDDAVLVEADPSSAAGNTLVAAVVVGRKRRARGRNRLRVSSFFLVCYYLDFFFISLGMARFCFHPSEVHRS